MSIEGQFILLAVATAFLTSDYEYSLRIASFDHSKIANSMLFLGNINRYRALASIKLFEHAILEGNIEQNFDLLA